MSRGRRYPDPTEPDLFASPALTRRVAHDKALGSSAKHRAALLGVLKAFGAQTADAAGALCGLGPLSARPRVTELAKEGLIEATGERRPSAQGNPSAVWRALP